MRKILPLFLSAAILLAGGTVAAVADSSPGVPVTQQAPMATTDTASPMGSSGNPCC